MGQCDASDGWQGGGVIITPGQNNTVCSLKRGEIFTAKITHILSGFRDFDGVDGFYIV